MSTSRRPLPSRSCPRGPGPRIAALTRLNPGRLVLAGLCLVGLSLVLATFLSQATAETAVLGGY
ncbi:MAG: hypothetical protein AB8I08_13925 [Sandaracinaceae bacterium]